MQRMSGILHFAVVSEDKGIIQFIQTRTRTSSLRTRMLSKVSKRKRALRGHYGRRGCPPILGGHGLEPCGAYRVSEQQSLVLRTGSPSQRNCVLRTGLPRQRSPGLRIGSPSQRSSILRTGSPRQETLYSEPSLLMDLLKEFATVSSGHPMLFNIQVPKWNTHVGTVLLSRLRTGPPRRRRCVLRTDNQKHLEL